MDTLLRDQLTNYGLSDCIEDFEYQEILTIDDFVNYTIDDYREMMHEKFITSIRFLLNTYKVADRVSQSLDYNDSNNRGSTKITDGLSNDVRECYLSILKNKELSILQRQKYFYTFFIKPNLNNKVPVVSETCINFEGKLYKFKKNTITIGRGCLEYPVDIRIKERELQDNSVSRVNCIIVKVLSDDDKYMYYLFDTWSIVGTRVTKTYPYQIYETAPGNTNIISWKENESVLISCGDTTCKNVIQVLSSDNGDMMPILEDEENDGVEIQREEEEEREEVLCVICYDPATIRLGCGHAVYCGNGCMDEHIAYQEEENGCAVCPFCKVDNTQNKQSICLQQYK